MLAVTGCGGSSGDAEPDSRSSEAIANVQSEVSETFSQQMNTIVREVVCVDTTDLDHFRCTVDYETPEGKTRRAIVLVTCDSDGCAWREQ